MDVYEYITLTPQSAESFSPFIPQTLQEGLLHGKVLGLGSMDNHMAVGALLFQVEEQKVTLRSLYVDEKQRRMGIGRGLVEKLSSILRNVPGIHSVRAILPDENKEAAAFFEAIGALWEVKQTEAEFPLSLLKKSSLMRVQESKYCFCGDKISIEELTYYQKQLMREGNYMLEGDLWSEPVCPSLSVYYRKENEIQGCVIITKEKKGLCLAMLASHGEVKIPPVLLGNLSHRLLADFKEETKIRMETVAPGTRRLLERLIPEAQWRERKIAVLPL